MRYLLDVNVLVAWGWADHLAHDSTAQWIAGMRRKVGVQLLTSAIPQLGFVRVSVQRTGGQVTVADASTTLGGMLNSLKDSHVFLADDRIAIDFPSWCQSASRTTDAHLLQLAEAHGAVLATLDTRIPGAYVLPPESS